MQTQEEISNLISSVHLVNKFMRGMMNDSVTIKAIRNFKTSESEVQCGIISIDQYKKAKKALQLVQNSDELKN